MIIADLTVWSRTLKGQAPTLQALFTDLRQRQSLSAPPIVFAQLLAEAKEERLGDRVRAWAVEAPPIDESPHAWLMAGDLSHHLRRQGVALGLLDCFLVALCLRDDAELWSFNPIFERVADLVPLRRYEPSGLRV